MNDVENKMISTSDTADRVPFTRDEAEALLYAGMWYSVDVAADVVCRLYVGDSA